VAPSQVSVRIVDAEVPAELRSLADLWADSRPSPRGHAGGRTDRGDIVEGLARAITRDGVDAFVAALDGADVGFVVLTRGPLLPLLDEPSVAIEHLFVRDAARRQGVGRALLARATTFAEQGGANQISTSVPASGREGQRFFARLGFSPFVIRRVASVSALRRRLVPEPCLARDATVLRRRSLRARSRALALRSPTSV
jgi:GNAT superfamily N-acetyltransferase